MHTKVKAQRTFTTLVAMVLALTMLPLALSAQKTIEIPLYASGDTSLWYKWRMADVQRMGAVDLTHTTDSFSLRFWTGTAMLFINCTSAGSQGEISYFTEEYFDRERKKPRRQYHITHTIPSEDCDSVLMLFSSLDLVHLPPQDSINGWRSGEDGEVFVVEVSTPTSYHFRDYWTPSAFPGIAEANVLQAFVIKVRELLEMREGFSAFILSLPPGNYRTGGNTVITVERSPPRN